MDQMGIGQPGYRFEDGSCLACSGSTGVVITIFIVAVIVLFLLAIKLNQLRFVREVSIPLRTGAVYFQTIALLYGNILHILLAPLVITMMMIC
jgi:hypothetical protein